MKHILSILVLVIVASGLQAQTVTKLPTDPTNYMKELVSYMKSTKRDDDKEQVEKFEENVSAGKIDEAALARVITTSNLMLDNRLRAHPHFHDYLNALNTMADKGTSGAKLNQWMTVLDSVVVNERKGRSKDFGDYVAFSAELFGENAIYSSKQKLWIASDESWELKYQEGGPRVVFASAVDLSGVTPHDTTVIIGTKGYYKALEQIWIGEGGKITWAKAGLDPSKVYAEFTNYQLPMDQPEFRIDSVVFYQKEFFDFSLEGVFIDKLTTQKSGNYPQFQSYRHDLEIDDLGPNVKYLGGFTLEGDQIIGSGGDGSKANLLFQQGNGGKAMLLKSDNIIIRKGEELYAKEAEATIFLGEDSIFHPGLDAKYRMEKKELTLYTGDDGIAASAFYDSYHNMEVHAEAIIWDVNTDTLRLKMMSGAGQKPITVASENYFRKGELEKYAAGVDFNPLSEIKMYSEQSRSRELYAEDLAKRMNPNYSENTIRRLLYKMVEDGFIYYDQEKGTITVKDKVFNYVFANADLRDYDIIAFESYSTQDNGFLTFSDNTINLEGVKVITISDSQDVRIFPGDHDIELHKDQDIKFSNIVIAGIIDFIGEGFYFDYDSFQIDLTDLAAAVINVPTGERDEDGDAIFVPLKSKIEGLTGYLNIDVPNNKAGKEPNPEYPIFTNREKSYVYYEAAEIHDSAYSREDFFFELDPFQFDSLITFDPYMSDLKGRLFSAEIFPTFEEQLKIQEDLSLGFQRTTPAEGYKIYKGKGQYTDSIFLSNAGLQGKGHVDHRFTQFDSKDILFTPDSLNAISDTFKMKQTFEGESSYPQVTGVDNDIHWLPYGDSMYINMRTAAFKMYGDSSSLKGNLLLTADALQGDGSFEFKEASLASEEFNFKANSLNSDTMAMQIKSLDADKVTFKTPNVSGNVDFENRMGTFKSNETDIATEFSNNYYKTAINEFFWDMDANILDFKSPPGSAGSFFISTREDQDSLKFLGTRAYFNMTTSIIDVTGVPYVLVADAKIVPDSNKVVIMPGGLLDTLNNAVVYADTAHERFKLYDADIIIESKRGYKGSGTYDYVYEQAEPQPLRFDSIAMAVDEKRKGTLYSTTATTPIEELDSFRINDGFSFVGQVNLQAENPLLEFEGGSELLKLSDKLGTPAAFIFKDRVNPDTVVLHYGKARDIDSTELGVGLYYNPLDSVSYYVGIMTPKHDVKDEPTLEASGVAMYDSKTETYYFGDEDRLINKGVNGNTVAYNTKEQTVHMEGPLDLHLDFTPIEMQATGSVDYWVDSSKLVFTALVGLDLPIEKDLIAQMGLDINSFVFDRPSADYTTDQFKAAYGNLIDGQKAAEKAVEELSTTGQFVRPKELSENIVIGEVELLYDPYYEIYRSISPITLSFVGETGIHKKLSGYLEFGLRKNNDFFNLYIESTFDDWYFISYKNNTLQIGTNKEDFNKLLAALDADKRTIKMKGTEEFFFYTISTYSAMQSFLQRMNLIESGERVEFEMESDQDELENELDLLRQELLDIENAGGDTDNGVVIPDLGDPRDSFNDGVPPPSDPRDSFDDGVPPPTEDAPVEDEVSDDSGAIDETDNAVEPDAEPVVEEEEDNGKKGKQKGKDKDEEETAPEEEKVEEEPAKEEPPMLQEIMNFEEDEKKGKKKKNKDDGGF